MPLLWSFPMVEAMAIDIELLTELFICENE